MTTSDVPSSAPGAEDKPQPMYLDLGEWVSDHFIPVLNPAPPRPRRAESFTRLTMASGCMPSAF